jgi:hypothetical protein
MLDIVLTFYDTCPYRKRNFNFVVDSILNTTKCHLIVCQQNDQSNDKKTSFSYEKRITYIYYNDSGSFKKSLLYNEAFKACKSNYILFLDSDVLLPFKNIELLLNSNTYSNLIKPFNSVFNLNEDQSDSILHSESVDLSSCEKESRLGKFGFIVSRKEFKRCGGFDDRFAGWGWEDIDFIENRLRIPNFDILDTIFGVHLFHPISSRKHERSNYILYKENSHKRRSFTFSIDCQYFKPNKVVLIDLAQQICQHNSMSTLLILLEEDFFLKKYFDLELIYELIDDKYKDLLQFVSCPNRKNFLDSIGTSVHIGEGSLHCRLLKKSELSKNIIQHCIGSRVDKGFIDNKNGLVFFSKAFFDNVKKEKIPKLTNTFDSLKNMAESLPVFNAKKYICKNNYGSDIDQMKFYNHKTKEFEHF